MGLGTLISKIFLLVTMVIDDLTQVFVVLFWWLVAILVVSSRRIDCIDPSGWSKVWKSWAIRATIMTTFSIMLIILMVLPRPVWGLGVLKTLKRLGFRLLQPEKVLIEDLFPSIFVRFEGGLIAAKTISIYFSDIRQKVESGFSLYSNDLLNDLFRDVLLRAILLDLGMDKSL